MFFVWRKPKRRPKSCFVSDCRICLHLMQVFLFGSCTPYDIAIIAHQQIALWVLKNWSCKQAKAKGNCSGAWTFSLLDMPWTHCTFDKVLHIAIPSLYREGKSHCKSFLSVVKHGSPAPHTTVLFSDLIWPAACQTLLTLDLFTLKSQNPDWIVFCFSFCEIKCSPI